MLGAMGPETLAGRDLAPAPASCGPKPYEAYAAGSHTTSIGPLYYLFVSLLVGALTLYVQREYLVYIPYTSLLFFEGMLFGLIHAGTGGGFRDLSYSIGQWTSIDPYLLSAVFLPALIFSDAMRVDIHLFRRIFWQAALMATAGVALQATGTAFVAKYFLSDVGFLWDWPFCFTFGAALSATDPIAVVAMLESVQAPAKLTTLMSGESHLSDLLALVAFNITLQLSKSLTAYTTEQLVRYIFAMVFGGPGLGLAFGILALIGIRANTARERLSDVMIQVTITLVVAYLSFIVSENNASGNGVLATVTAAIVIAAYAWPSFASPQTIRSVWKAIEFTGSTVIFMLAGLVIGTNMYDYHGTYITGSIYGIAIIMWLFVYAIRTGIMIVFFPILSRIGYGLKLSEGIVMTWGGLKGAVAVTLGLIVSNSYSELHNSANPDVDAKRDTVQFFFLVAAVVFLSVSINSSTTPLIMKALRVLSKSGVQRLLLRGIKKRIRDKAKEAFEGIVQDPEYSDVSREKLSETISALKEVDANDFREKRPLMKRFLQLFNRWKKPPPPPEMVECDGHTCNQELLEVVRELFLDIVKATYWDMIDNGILPKNSSATRTLLQSVDIAKDLVTLPLNDYSFMNLPDTRDDDENALHERIFERIDKCLPQWVTIDDYFGDRFHAMVRENAVFMASSFIHAHREAQSKVAQYVGEGSEADSPEELVVIKESEALVQKAIAYMNICKDRDPDIVSLVTTKKVGSHVLIEQDNLIDGLNKQGVIDETTAEDLHDRINAEYVDLFNLTLNQFRRHKSQKSRTTQVSAKIVNGEV